MTIRQRILKALYPVVMLFTKRKANVVENEGQPAHASFYDLSTIANNGSNFKFDQLKDKYVLLVNIASNCGYTGQYAELQTLYTQYKPKLEIIGFPANDFKEQEKGSDAEIAEFCKLNYGVSFPIMKKSTVITAADQNSVYQWLTQAQLNGWNSQAPTWNFSKYLIAPDGELVAYIDPAISPLHESITKHLS